MSGSVRECAGVCWSERGWSWECAGVSAMDVGLGAKIDRRMTKTY